LVGNGAPRYGDNIEGVGARGPSNTNDAYNQQNQSQNQNNLYVNGDVRNSNGSLAALPGEMNLAIATAYFNDGSSSYGLAMPGTFSDGEGGTYNNHHSVQLDSSGNLVSYQVNELYSYGSSTYSSNYVGTAVGTTVDKGISGELSWLRINGYVHETYSYVNTYSGYTPYTSSGYNDYYYPSYIFGNATSISDINALSLASYQATYTYAGGTSPTDSTGVSGSVLAASFTADFGSRQITNGILNVSMPSGGSSSVTYLGTFNGYFNTPSAAIYINGSVSYGSGSSGSLYGKGFFCWGKCSSGWIKL
jgi:hypothetical protein